MQAPGKNLVEWLNGTKVLVFLKSKMADSATLKLVMTSCFFSSSKISAHLRKLWCLVNNMDGKCWKAVEFKVH